MLISSLMPILGAYLFHGYDMLPALGYSASFFAAAWQVHLQVAKGLDGPRAALA